MSEARRGSVSAIGIATLFHVRIGFTPRLSARPVRTERALGKLGQFTARNYACAPCVEYFSIHSAARRCISSCERSSFREAIVHM